MKAFISADMEGIWGVIDADMTTSPHPDYARAREYMTDDVIAAIEGARQAGATEIVVRDAHGAANNILVERLPEGVRVIQGWTGLARMMEGFDETFDAALLVGYHARAGAEDGCISHTMAFRIKHLWYNGVELGEYAISAAHAGHFGVPLVFASGDEALCREVREVLGPQVTTAAVKASLTRECVSLLPMAEARDRIRSGVARALDALPSVPPFCPACPIEVKVEFDRAIQAEAASLVPTVRRVNTTTVAAPAPDGVAAANLVAVFYKIAGQG